MPMSGNSPQLRIRSLSGIRCSVSVAILLGFFLILHLYSHISPRNEARTRILQLHTRHNPLLHELEQVEEENIKIPPRETRAPRAIRRRPKRSTPLIDEFLDEDSKLRHLFYPGMDTAVDPRKNTRIESLFYYPGRIWLDTEGNPIQAHGGGILHDEISGTYYWYGEYKDAPTYHAHENGPARVDIIGVGCYSSKDLWKWKKEGIVLASEETDESHDLHKSNVLERPKVIYNAKTRKYVMWMHIDNCNYTKATAGVAISDSPTGPFAYLYSKRPHGFDSRDMTVFKDEDGIAYLVYSCVNNNELHIGPLAEDYLDVKPVMKRLFVGERREAPALFKYQGIYYMVTSGCTGWAPNEALVHAAESIMGPWETIGDPCVVGNELYRLATFLAQSTFVVPLPGGVPGSFIFMADRWNPAELRDSRYVWLPLIVDGGPTDRPVESGFGFPLWSRVSIYWHKKWRLPSGLRALQ